jgi:predicted dehydrogenase
METGKHKTDVQSTATRREFLEQATAAVATVSVLGGAALTSAKDRAVKKVTTRVLGANDRINLAFIGNGMQFLGLLQRGFVARKEKLGDFEYSAVCDVWEPRLKYAQEQTKAEKIYSDYREVIARPDIDGVVIAVPDHWHYAIAREACLSGKDVYLEKPMTYTIDQAARLNDVVDQTKRILQVGGTGPSTRLYWKVNEYINAGKMGKILWGLISYNRNTAKGMWDYPIPGIGSEAWPDAEVSEKNLDWKTWLGPAPKRPFSTERYFRWRKYWDYSGGNATDLLYHRLGVMSTMVGFAFPTRVSAAGGIYVQKDREVPDTYMTMVEYPGSYSVNMISCMANADSAPLAVYGNWATLQIVTERHQAMDSMGDQTKGRSQWTGPVERAVIKPQRDFLEEFKQANEGKAEVTIDPEPSEDLIDNWLNCMRNREKPVYDVMRGYQVMVAIKLGVDSYRQGKTLAFDPDRRRTLNRPPARRT